MKCHRSHLINLAAALSLTMAADAQTFTQLKSFGILTNKVGTVTRSQLVLGSDGMLYGTTSAGGGIMRGSVFKIGTNGASFVLLKQFTNLLDGAFPKSSLLLNGTTLYGTTTSGGSENGGTVFKINADGTGFTVLKAFSAGSYDRNLPPPPSGGGSAHEPSPPMGGLALSGTTLYGTTRSGGTAARGNVFKLETNGSGYTVLKEFSGADGAAPTGDLVVSGSTIYGTTSYGGSANTGTVFRVNVDGTGFTTLKHFTGPDGAGPYAGLVLSGGTLFGVTVRGGAFSSQAGTVFKINTDGSGFVVLKSFSATAIPPQGVGPMGRLLLSDNVLYGTAGSLLNFVSGVSTIFRLNPDGTGFATIISGITNPTNSAFFSQAGLVLSGGKLYGTMNGPNLTPGAGLISDQVFSVNTNGTGRTTLKRFDNSSGDAIRPTPVVLADGMLYGASQAGGVSNAGAIFAIHTNGGGYTLLKSLNGSSDGGFVAARLSVAGSAIYGAAVIGGAQQAGTIFKLNTNGAGFTVLHNFNFSEGGNAYGMSLSGDVLYVALESSGDNGNGTVGRMNSDGNDFMKLRDFDGTDGAGPWGEPLVVGDLLYGVTSYGGSNGLGTIYRMFTNGTGFTVLRHVDLGDQIGYFPPGRLALSGNTLFGIGGDFTGATVFRIDTDGSGYATVARLEGSQYYYPLGPGGLIINGSVIYGVTGTALFQVNTNGTGLYVFKLFQNPLEGTQPNGDLVLAGETLYGTTAGGGELGEGTIFSLGLRPRLTIAQTASNLTLSWPAYATDYQLEQNVTLTGSSWSNVLASISNDGTNHTVTVPTSFAAFYRLRR